MKAGSSVFRWRSAIGASVMGCLALCLTFDVAPAAERTSSESRRSAVSVSREAKLLEREARSSDTLSSESRVRYSSMRPGSLPILEPQIVDWRADIWTQMRERGELVGPAPAGFGLAPSVNVAGVVSCSFDIQCDDGDPCTTDNCDIEVGAPAGSGTCENIALADGLPGGCPDEVFCNGIEACNGGVCTAGSSPCSGGDVCSESLGTCHAPCSVDADCDDGLGCNGDETCNVDVCEPADAFCGAGGDCVEKFCFGAGCGIGCRFEPCATTDDCPAGACIDGPLCFDGRCCTASGGGEFACGFRTKAECDGDGGLWYASDTGRFLTGSCDSDQGCPKYTSGIIDQDVLGTIGPISLSPAQVDEFSTQLVRVGDDYTMSNDSFILLDKLRFIGRIEDLAQSRVRFEWYDENGNFVEDFLFIGNDVLAIQVFDLEPNLIIPGSGFLVATIASNFTPQGRFHWATTDSADVGTNDPAVLWLDNVLDNSGSEFGDPGGPVGNLSTSGVLAFELEGEKIDPPGGACCDGTTGDCFETQLWLCNGAGGTYAGDGSQCATCGAGSLNIGQPCRVCSEDNVTPCASDDDCSGTCVPNDGLCMTCNADSDNPGTACTVDGECPNGLCEGACVPLAACAAGACCDPVGGCTETDIGSCTGTFLGFGSNCDPNCCDASSGNRCSSESANAGEACASDGECTGGTCVPPDLGSDDCETAVVHQIPVPSVAGPENANVLTITGNNSPATSTSADPDSCFPPSTDAEGQELGWYHAFEIDDCALVRIDHCCTEPVKQPGYRIIYDRCPCGTALFSVPRPGDPGGLGPGDRGGPFCAEDNLWGFYGPLAAGVYYYPVFSQLIGQFDDYQMHIVVEACPKAACCQVDEFGVPFCEDLDVLACRGVGGYYQGPPNTESGTLCSGSLCNTGSCCLGPGECQDDDGNGSPMDIDLCVKTLGGSYVGGVSCFGGTCSSSTEISCLTDEDCPGLETCTGDAQDLAQVPACPICEIQGPGNCQTFDPNSTLWSTSDRSDGQLGTYAADDFVPAGSTIDTVCVWGVYLDGDPEATEPSCGDNVIDNFRVRVYESDGVSGILPGTLVGESTTSSVRSIIPNTAAENTFDNPVFVYGAQLALDTPISGLLTDGTVYFLEVTNEAIPVGSDPDEEKCNWSWFRLQTTENGFAAAGSEAGYATGAQRPWDFAFCLGGNGSPTPITPGGGLQTEDLARSCCACTTDCGLQTLEDCDNANSRWNIDDDTPGCLDTVCDGAPPPGDRCQLGNCSISNDVCGNDDECPDGETCDGLANIGHIVVPGDNATINFDNYCSSLDGFPTVVDEFLGEAPADTDIWFAYTPTEPGNLQVSMCPVGDAYDSLIGIYFDPSNPTVCPCPVDQATDSTTRFVDEFGAYGADENCNGLLDGSAGFLVRSVEAGNCYVVRAAGYAGQGNEVGAGTINFSLTPVTANPVSTPDADPDGPPGTASSCEGGDNDGVVCSLCDGGSRDGGPCYAAGATDCPGGGECVVVSAVCTGGGTCTAAAPWPKARSLTVSLPAALSQVAGTASNAIRVKLVDVPLAPGLNGEVRWLGPPADYFEGDSFTPQLGEWRGSELQCDPFFTDWTAEGVVSAFGPVVVPGSTFELQAIDEGCDATGQDEGCFSEALTIKTAAYGDIIPPLEGATNLAQPNIGDVLAAVDKFLGSTSAPTKPRVMQLPALPKVNGKVDLQDILGIVDSFLGADYSLAPAPGACP